MSVDPNSELVRFNEFLLRQIEQKVPLTPEEALDLWREENPMSQEIAHDRMAVRAALRDADEGDIGVSLEELDRAIRMKLGMSSDE
jgi:hypothetical protein